MKKLDRRVRRTRRMLAEALVDLALESSYDEISIRKLTDRADVGYATFYRHFKSKDELLQFLVESAANDLWKTIEAVDSQRDAVEAMFQHVRSIPQVYRLFVSLPESNPARKMIRAQFMTYLNARYEPRKGANVPPEVAFSHIIQSATGLLSWYLDNIEAYTPQELTAMYSDLIGREAIALSLVRRARSSLQLVADEADSDIKNQ